MKTAFKRMMLAAMICAFAAPAFAQDEEVRTKPNYNQPQGLWLTENERSVIEVKDCEQGLCGTVHWIIEGGMQVDEHNPVESERGKKMCGLPIMWGFKQETDRTWIDGTIYKADEGDTYDATIQMLPSGKMLVRGYVGMPMFGKSQTWTPVDAKDYPKCK